MIFILQLWKETFAEFNLLHDWRSAEYDIVKEFATSTFTECVIACHNEHLCDIPAIQGMDSGGKICYFLKGKPNEQKTSTGLKKKADVVLISQVI